HSDASAETMSTATERADGCGAESNCPPHGTTPQAGSMRTFGLKGVAHEHSHAARVLGRPVREHLADLLSGALGRALRIFLRKARLAGFLPRHEAVRAPRRIAVGESTEELDLGDLGAARDGGTQGDGARFGFGARAARLRGCAGRRGGAGRIDHQSRPDCGDGPIGYWRPPRAGRNEAAATRPTATRCPR